MDEDTTKDDADLTVPEDVTPDSWKTICPRCGESIPGKLLKCPNCGHDFREDVASTGSGDGRKQGIAYSALADIALSVGQTVAIIGCVIAVIAAIALTFRANFFGLFLAMLSFFYSLALYVVFVRVQDMRGKE